MKMLTEICFTHEVITRSFSSTHTVVLAASSYCIKEENDAKETILLCSFQ